MKIHLSHRPVWVKRIEYCCRDMSKTNMDGIFRLVTDNDGSDTSLKNVYYNGDDILYCPFCGAKIVFTNVNQI